MKKIAQLATVFALVASASVMADTVTTPKHAPGAVPTTAPVKDESMIRITETEFRASLTPETKPMYDNLDAEGKANALKLANQGRERNAAVKEASKKMVEMKAHDTLPPAAK